MNRKNESHSAKRRSGADRATESDITPERIKARAYALFLARNGGPGDALTDWLQAEAQLRGTPTAEPEEPPLVTVFARGEALLLSGD